MKVFAGEQASGLAAKESEALAQILVAPKPEKRVELDSVGHSSAGVIMEKIRGPRLDGVLQRPVGSPSIPELWMALAEGIANIHAAGWVHGDISTRNAFLCEEPSRRQLPGYPSSATHTNGAEANNHCIRLIDFATGRKLSDDRNPGEVSDSQASRRVLGTPYFMAPEVALGGIAQQASDVYSMGCIIHEFVTGRHLFDGATSIEICWRQANTPVCLPSQEELRRSGLTLDHGRLLEQILEKRPASRPTIDQVVERLKAIESK
jgi:serine/threonine protein kinase